jgi:membrane-associated phospholipid phosphatase
MWPIDISIQNYFVSARTSFMTESMYVITSVFDASVHFILVVLCVSTLIYLVRNLKYALLFFGALSFGAVLVFILKNIFDVTRPLDGFMSVFGQSFPSHHATSATIFFVMLMYVFDSYLGRFAKVTFNTFCVVCITLVAFSRIYLGVHWFTDVISGIILGVLISYFSIVIFKRVINMQGSTSMVK